MHIGLFYAHLGLLTAHLGLLALDGLDVKVRLHRYECNGH